jgi:hypothetical protein
MPTNNHKSNGIAPKIGATAPKIRNYGVKGE